MTSYDLLCISYFLSYETYRIFIHTLFQSHVFQIQLTHLNEPLQTR